MRPVKRGNVIALAFLALVLHLPVSAKAAVSIERVVSPGGIEAWLVEDHTLPMVSLNAAFQGGASLDPEGKVGLAAMVAGLLDEGAGPLDSQAYQGRLEDLASSVSFGASEDSFSVVLKSLTANVPQTFDLLRLSLSEPRFDQEPVTRVRGELLNNLSRQAQEPRYLASRTFWRTAYGSHPYARPSQGRTATVNAITVEDLRRFTRDRLGRDVLLIGVVGDITPEALKPLLDKTFGGLPAKAAPGVVADTPAVTDGATLLVKKPIPQSVVTFGEPGILRSDPDWYAALLVSTVLGGSSLTSRLALEIREKRGLAYGVNVGMAPLKHSGVILGSVATANARIAQSIDIIRQEWRRMRDDGPTEEELQDTKRYLTGSFPLSLDSTGSVASLLVLIQQDKLGIDYLEKRSALINGVTLDEAKRVARRLFDPDKLTFVVVGSPDELPNAREVTPGG